MLSVYQDGQISMEVLSELASGDRPILVYDGGCIFCHRFAEISELHSGIPGLAVIDGRADTGLRHRLELAGAPLSKGAILIVGDDIHHGSKAIHWLCARMNPSTGLLQVFASLFAEPTRARRYYPLLLLLRRLALAIRGLPVNPDSRY